MVLGPRGLTGLSIDWHPSPNAAHTWSGFSTGTWQDNVLNIYTTHLKENYMRRWGPMRSDDPTVRIRYKRLSPNYLRATVIIYDPVYFAEPYIRTSLIWVLDPALVLPPYPCEEATESVVEHGAVPHYLPGTNPYLTEFASKYGIPLEATNGGAQTMYPEYAATMKPGARG